MAEAKHTTAVIEFHGHELNSWRDEQTGKAYAVIASMCRVIGMDDHNQVRRLQGNPLFSDDLQRGGHIATPGGVQDPWGLDIEKVETWLVTINSRYVKLEYQDILLTMQKECAKVLHAYWNKTGAPSQRQLTSAEMFLEQAKLMVEHEQRLGKVEAEVSSVRDDIDRIDKKADAAFEAAGRKTFREFVRSGNLQRQFPGVWLRQYHLYVWPREEKRLKDYSFAWAQPIIPKPVDGMPWEEEDTYSLKALEWIARYPNEHGGYPPYHLKRTS